MTPEAALMVFLMFAGDPASMAFGQPMQMIRDMDTCKDLLWAYDIVYRDGPEDVRRTVDGLHCVSFKDGQAVEAVGMQDIRQLRLKGPGL